MKRFNSELEVKEFCKENKEQITAIAHETTSKLLSLPCNAAELEPAIRPGKIRKVIFKLLLNNVPLSGLHEQLYNELVKEIEPNAKEVKIALNIGFATLHTICEPKTAAETVFNENFDDIVDAVHSLILQINDIPDSDAADIAILCHLQSNVLSAITDSSLSPSDAVKENLLSTIRAEIELQNELK